MARMDPSKRKTEILSVAVDVAKRDGLNKMTRDNVAEEASVAVGLINHYFNTMSQLRRAVIRNAIHQLDNGSQHDEQLLTIVAQGLVNKESAAQKAPDEIKQAALNTLI